MVQLSNASTTALDELDSVPTSRSQEAVRRPSKVAARKVAGVRKKELDWKRECFTMSDKPFDKLLLVYKETMQRLNKHKKNGKKFALTSFRRAGANEQHQALHHTDAICRIRHGIIYVHFQVLPQCLYLLLCHDH